MRSRITLVGVGLLVWLGAGLGTVVVSSAEPVEAEVLEVRKIWEHAPHNAFTDLTWFKDRWFCVFREGQAHVSPDGAVRVLASEDGQAWRSVALLRRAADLRDPKLTVTPNQRLMLHAAEAPPHPAPFRHQSLAWFSADGTNWGQPVWIGQPNLWMWRVTWHQGLAWTVGYSTTSNRFTRLYASRDGRLFETRVDRLFAEGYPNEATLVFPPEGRALCLLRRDAKPLTALLGLADPPYTNWVWKDLGLRLGGPNLIRLPDGRLVVVARLYIGGTRTALLWLDAETGALREFLKLPSGGDTSYAGLVWHEDRLWISYYSSHEGKAAIYLAKVRFAAPSTASPVPE